jgi:homoserine O-acetyltransferase
VADTNLGEDDEYSGDMMNDGGTTFVVPELKLESGNIMKEVDVRYCTWGELNSSRDNVLVVSHALTGNANLESWWGELLGPGKPFDTSKYFVVCFNILGSCYGSCGPKSINPATGAPYGIDFPAVTVSQSFIPWLMLPLLSKRSLCVGS